MNVQLTADEKELINNIVSENGFGEYELTTNQATSKGDNFLGILTIAEIKHEDKSLNLIIKSAMENEVLRNKFPLGAIYEREIYLYQVIFEEFKKYQTEHNIEDPFLSTAKFYGASKTKKSFALENLKAKQYQLWNRKVPMNPEHISAVLIEYAKFHSISLAIKYKNPDLYEKISQECAKNIFETEMSNGEMFLKNAKVQIENNFHLVEDDDVLLDALKNYLDKFETMFNNMKEPSDIDVIIHGDCWCNNFMFKYQNEPTKPTEVRIIDWQLSRKSSPAFDLAYFITANGSKEIFNNYEHYLHLYHDKVSSQLRNFNCDPDIIFPYSELEKHFKIFAPFGLYMCMLILKMMVSDSGEVPDFSDYDHKNDDGENKMGLIPNYEIKNNDVYKERFKTVFRFMIDNKFI